MYQKIAEKLLKDLYFDGLEVEPFIWGLFLQDLNQCGVTLDSLSKDFEEGIKNGYSIDEQIKAVFDNLK